MHTRQRAVTIEGANHPYTLVFKGDNRLYLQVRRSIPGLVTLVLPQYLTMALEMCSLLIYNNYIYGSDVRILWPAWSQMAE